MSIEQPKFIESTQEQKSAPIMDLLVEEARYLREKGFNVTDTCELESDRELNERAEQREKDWGDKSKTDGQKLEQLSTVVLNEYFKESNKNGGYDLYVIRSTKHDDTWNATDNFLVDKKTGKILAAFDEVVDDQRGRKFEAKINKSRKINEEKGGARISYTPHIKEGEDTKEIISENIPHFVLQLSKAQLDNAMDMIAKLGSSTTKKSQFMTGVFDIFAKQIENQISTLDKSLKIDQDLANNLYALEGMLKKISKRR